MSIAASALLLVGLLALFARHRIRQVQYLVIHSKTGAILTVPKAKRFQ